MKSALDAQSGAESNINLTRAPHTEYPPFSGHCLPSPPHYPTVLEYHEFGEHALETPSFGLPIDMESTDGEAFREGSAPINIKTRKRTRTTSSGISASPDTQDSLNNPVMEQRFNFGKGQAIGSSPKQGRGMLNSCSSLIYQMENSCDSCVSPDNPSLSPNPGSFPNTNMIPTSKILEGKRTDKPAKETLSQEDHGIIEKCLQTGIQLINDKGLKKTDGLSIDWVKAPAKKVRPSYTCEGSRGAIKTEDGGPVELSVRSTSGLMETSTAVLIAACISDKKEQKVTGHPHFKTNCVSDQPSLETEIDGVSVICIKKNIQGEPFNLKLDVGIKRRGERTSKLDRKCRVIYRLCLLHQRVDASRTVIDWQPGPWAQIVTDTISCEQSQGPPMISNMTSKSDNVNGGLVVATKGKNFESKAEERSLVVRLSSRRFDWTADAKVYHEVTTTNSLAFKVPAFKKWQQVLKRYPDLTSFPMQLEVLVDQRPCETPSDFTYTLDEKQKQEFQHDEFNGLPFEDVMCILHEVEQTGSVQQNGSHAGQGQPLRATTLSPRGGFDQENSLYSTSTQRGGTQRAVWKVEQDFTTSCTMAANDRTLQWELEGSQEQTVNQQFGDQKFASHTWQN